MSPHRPKQTTKQQIAIKRAELNACFDNFSSVKRTNNLNWLRRQVAFVEPQVLCPVSKKYLDETNMSNIAITYDFIMENKSQEITVEDIRIIHAKLCTNTNIDGYHFRTTNCKLRMSINGMTYNAPDYSMIDYQLRQIVYNMNHSKHDILTRAYDAHYEIIMLQPFDDFNKRTARLIMNWLLLQNGYRPITFNKRSDKVNYIQALQTRACGDKRAYTEYMAKCQLRTQEQILKHLRDSKIY
ncbi:MAG: Fic family protein [Alphaproteobacteria bacterium]|nr:Fic family protein [Alphaproteobacteria bacterium]